MLGSAIFEAAIGTVVIYILLSLICLVLNEWITRLLRLRSGILKEELTHVLGRELAKALAEQPLIRGTFNRERYPNYIPTSTFALAMMEIGYEYTPGVKGEPGVTKVKSHWTGSSHGLLEGLRLAATSMGPLQARIEKWFDLAMEQASGRFKQHAQLYILALSGVITISADVDTISIAGALYDGAVSHVPTHFPLFWTDSGGGMVSKGRGHWDHVGCRFAGHSLLV